MHYCAGRGLPIMLWYTLLQYERGRTFPHLKGEIAFS
jgi:hypothetical protein